jgi:hypothetical protein
MANDNIYIFNAETGEEIVRAMTDDEQAIRNAEVAAALAVKSEANAKAKADGQAKAALLERLGITADEAKLLLA